VRVRISSGRVASRADADPLSDTESESELESELDHLPAGPEPVNTPVALWITLFKAEVGEMKVNCCNVFAELDSWEILAVACCQIEIY